MMKTDAVEGNDPRTTKARRVGAAAVAVLSLAGVALLPFANPRPPGETWTVLVITLTVAAIAMLFRAWQLGGSERGNMFVPSSKTWKRILFFTLVLAAGGFVAVRYFTDPEFSVGTFAAFMLFTAYLILVLLFDRPAAGKVVPSGSL